MLFSFLYNCLLMFVLVLYSPIHIFKLMRATKYRRSTLPRLGFQKFPQRAGFEGKIYLFHSVSVGETQAAEILIDELKKREPNCRIYLSTVTETGQDVAAKIKLLDGHFFLPFDLSFLMRRLFRQLRPDAVMVVETDLWLTYLRQAQKASIPVYLINAKLSEKSMRGYQRMPWLQRALLDPLSHLFVQSETYQQRFVDSGIPIERMTLAGNIKLDRSIPRLDEQAEKELRKRLGLQSEGQLLVFGSTHAGEEELALRCHLALREKCPALQTLIVPRHPERFEGVAQMILQQGVDFSRSSKGIDSYKGLILVDEMGVLMSLYQLCDVAVVCGSFTDKVGGHNILEPAFYGKPFVYGPWVFKQPGFYQLCLQESAGHQCEPEKLQEQLQFLLSDKKICQESGEHGEKIVLGARGAAASCAQYIVDNTKYSLATWHYAS